MYLFRFKMGVGIVWNNFIVGSQVLMLFTLSSQNNENFRFFLPSIHMIWIQKHDGRQISHILQQIPILEVKNKYYKRSPASISLLIPFTFLHRAHLVDNRVSLVDVEEVFCGLPTRTHHAVGANDKEENIRGGLKYFVFCASVTRYVIRILIFHFPASAYTHG